jgi:hypothetical protein
MTSQKSKQRTYARNRTLSRKGHLIQTESDGQYLLKLVLIILLGTVWLKFSQPFSVGPLPVAAIPVGMLFGLLIISRVERQQVDRKIWYAILLVITVISYFAPAGIVL